MTFHKEDEDSKNYVGRWVQTRNGPEELNLDTSTGYEVSHPDLIPASK